MTKQDLIKLINPADSLGFLMGQSNLLKDKLLDKHLEALDITAAQAKVLFNISYFGQSRACDIGKHLGVDGSAITRMLDRLVKKELISREAAPEDRRALQIELTEKGQDVIQQALPLARAALEELTQPLSADEIQQLKTLLRKILSASGCSLITENLMTEVNQDETHA